MASDKKPVVKEPLIHITKRAHMAPAKALGIRALSILAALPGITTPIREEQPLKSELLMIVTPSGITTVPVSLEQFRNAESPR